MSMKHAADLNGKVRIVGVINDEEFAADGDVSGNPSTGEFRVRLDYNHIPAGWHPHMYIDVKVGLLFLREEDGGQNFLTLSKGKYRSTGSIDLGGGFSIRNNAEIAMRDEHSFIANYAMFGVAHLGELAELEHFEETMLPMGPGQIAAIALARWKRPGAEPVDAVFATRYRLSEPITLGAVQVRRLHAEPSVRGKRFECTYTAFVRALPHLVETGGPYIGHLIA